MTMQNAAADRWASAQSAAKDIIDWLSFFDGELISPWEDEELGVHLECGDQVAEEVRRLLPEGWETETNEDGLVLRRVEE